MYIIANVPFVPQTDADRMRIAEERNAREQGSFLPTVAAEVIERIPEDDTPQEAAFRKHQGARIWDAKFTSSTGESLWYGPVSRDHCAWSKTQRTANKL